MSDFLPCPAGMLLVRSPWDGSPLAIVFSASHCNRIEMTDILLRISRLALCRCQRGKDWHWQVNILKKKGGGDVSEKSLKMSWFPVFVCRVPGGNGHPWTLGGARNEEFHEIRPAEVVLMHTAPNPGGQNGNPGQL